MASKIARIVYAMLKTNQPYDPHCHLLAKNKKSNLGNETPRVIRRFKYLEAQIQQFHQEFEAIFKKYDLEQVPLASEVLNGFKQLAQNLQREPILSELEEKLKRLRREDSLRKKKRVDRQIGG